MVSVHPAYWSVAYKMPSQSVRGTLEANPCLDSVPCWPGKIKKIKKVLRRYDTVTNGRNQSRQFKIRRELGTSE